MGRIAPTGAERWWLMRYRVEIGTEYNASAVLDVVTSVCGSWEYSVDGVGGDSGTGFVAADGAEDDEALTSAMEDHPGVVEYVCLGQTRVEQRRLSNGA